MEKPIRIKTDLIFGQTWYIVNDVEQLPRILVGITVLKENQIKFHLSYLGDVCEVWDYECSSDMIPEVMRKDFN